MKNSLALRGDDGDARIAALVKVANLKLTGKVPNVILPVGYGANLLAFRKKDGGVRPIAVGNVLQRVVAGIYLADVIHWTANFPQFSLGLLSGAVPKQPYTQRGGLLRKLRSAISHKCS